MRLPAIFPATAAALMLVGCSPGQSAAPAASPVASVGVGDSYVVENYTFPPLTASPGQLVRVTNGDDEPHTITAEDGAFDTGSFDRADPGSFTAPNTPGAYRFVCRVHPSMEGELTVR